MSGPTRQFIGGLLMAAGGLLAVLSGLCTGWFQIVLLLEWWRAPPPGPYNHEFHLQPWLPPVFGALPILTGVGLFLWGRWLRRRASLP